MAVWGRGVIWPYPEVVDGYALPLEGPGLGIEANTALVDEALAVSRPFVPSLQPRLNALDGSVRDFWEDPAMKNARFFAQDHRGISPLVHVSDHQIV